MISQQLCRLGVGYKRRMTFKAFVERNLREVSLDKDWRWRGAAGVITIDMKDFVCNRSILQRQAKCLHSIAHIGDRPQQIARTGRSRRGPIAFGVFDHFQITLLPERFDGEPSGPTGLDGDLGSRAVEAPVVVDTQADGRKSVRIGVSPACLFAEQLAQSVFILG